MIEWFKRPKDEPTDLAERKVWRSHCGRYKIEWSHIKYGRGRDKRGEETGYPPIYRFMVCNELGHWTILDYFRRKTSVFKAADYYHSHGCLPPKPKRRKKVKIEDAE